MSTSALPDTHTITNRTAYAAWLGTDPALVSPIDLSNQRVCALDLGLTGTATATDYSKGITDAYIDRLLVASHATVGVGGYAENRPFYTTPAYRVDTPQGPRYRSLHLGLDYWTPAGTPVYAPLDGRVVVLHDNALERDYGPTLMLAHTPATDLTFYTLYGHLDPAVLRELKLGESVTAGQRIARVGSRARNGNWPPHLHFQLTLDLLGNTTNFPGVAFPAEAAYWLALCPSPYAWFPGLPVG